MSSASLDCLPTHSVLGERWTVDHARPTRSLRFEDTPPGGRRSAKQVALTRRGRLVILMAVLAVAFAGFALVSGPAASTATTHHATAPTVVVQPGQTLWDIAVEASPSADPREVVAAIMELNDLVDPGAIRAGQPLYVPRR